MTIEEYTLPEQEFSTSETDIKTIPGSKGISIHKNYYWKRKARDLQEASSQSEIAKRVLNWCNCTQIRSNFYRSDQEWWLKIHHNP